MQNPFKYSDIEFNNIVFSKVKENGNKKSLYIKYKDNNNNLHNFYIQTPVMILEKINKINNLTELLINVSQNNEKVIKFLNFINKLESYIIKTSKNKKWDVNKLKLRSIIRNNNNKKIIKLKINNDMISNLNITFNNQTQNGDIFSLKEGQNIKYVLEIYGLWINKKGYGIFLKPLVADIRLSKSIKFYDSSDSECTELIDTEVIDNDNIESVALKMYNVVENNGIIDFKIDDIVSIDSDSDIDTIKDSNLLEIYDNNKNILESSESSDSLGMNSENILNKNI